MGYGLGIFLLALGLILALAVQDTISNVDLTMIGWILALAGVLVLVLTAVQTNRGRSTVCDYLYQFIREERPANIAPWVANDVYQRVVAAARQVGTDRLKPIFLALGEQVSYDDIRLVLAHLASQGA